MSTLKHTQSLGTDHLTWRGGGYGFLFRSEKNFRTTQEFEYYFFCRAKCEFFFQILTLGWQKLWIRFFFFLTKIRIFFTATLGIRIFFLKKTITKLNGHSLSISFFCILFILHDYTIIHRQNILILLSKQTFCNTTLKFHSPRTASNGNHFYIPFV